MNSESNKEYSVNWKNHMSHVRKAFDNLLNTNELTDVTLCCEGKKMGAHKMLLSACSTYFRDIFKDVPCQHPVIILYGVEYSVLSDILHFIYNGEVSVDTAKLDIFLKTAQLLQISGLTDSMSDRDETVANEAVNPVEEHTYVPPVASSTFNEHPKKGSKRSKTEDSSESYRDREKVIRQDGDAMFISDVKCEPSELVNFEDPLEDPLLQSEQPNDVKDFFRTSGSHDTGEEFKLTHLLNVLRTDGSYVRGSSSLNREQRLDGTFHVLTSHPAGKRKDCVVCSNRKVPGSRRVTPFLCETCIQLPSLHAGECFKKYHTLDNYKMY